MTEKYITSTPHFELKEQIDSLTKLTISNGLTIAKLRGQKDLLEVLCETSQQLVKQLTIDVKMQREFRELDEEGEDSILDLLASDQTDVIDVALDDDEKKLYMDYIIDIYGSKLAAEDVIRKYVSYL